MGHLDDGDTILYITLGKYLYIYNRVFLQFYEVEAPLL